MKRLHSIALFATLLLTAAVTFAQPPWGAPKDSFQKTSTNDLSAAAIKMMLLK
jgi:hypothetical protein